MNFELEAEKLSSEIFMKKSFVVKRRRKVTEPQTDENLLQKLLKKSNIKKTWKKKLAKNKVLKHKN